MTRAAPVDLSGLPAGSTWFLGEKPAGSFFMSVLLQGTNAWQETEARPTPQAAVDDGVRLLREFMGAAPAIAEPAAQGDLF
jgi:hypothetical protein